MLLSRTLGSVALPAVASSVLRSNRNPPPPPAAAFTTPPAGTVMVAPGITVTGPSAYQPRGAGDTDVPVVGDAQSKLPASQTVFIARASRELPPTTLPARSVAGLTITW